MRDADALLNSGSYSDAAKKFEDLDRDHPYAPEARRAIVMAAYAYYKAGKYPEAHGRRQALHDLHPGTKDAALAHHIIASANFDEIKDPQRDQTATRKALAELKMLAQRYPDSPYAKQASNRIRIAEDMLAASEMNVGRYYLKRQNYVGAINRFKTVVAEYQTTAQVEEALYRLVEANMALGIVPEAQAAAAVLGHNYPELGLVQARLRPAEVGRREPADRRRQLVQQDAEGADARRAAEAARAGCQPKAPAPGLPSPDDMPAPQDRATCRRVERARQAAAMRLDAAAQR